MYVNSKPIENLELKISFPKVFKTLMNSIISGVDDVPKFRPVFLLCKKYLKRCYINSCIEGPKATFYCASMVLSAKRSMRLI